MRKFILKLTRTIIVIYLLLSGLQLIIDFYLKKDNCCNNNTWHRIFEGEVQAEVVVLGTSRAEVHYDTQIIKNITGLKTYNLGLSGTHYNLLKIRWKSYLNHNKKPKILILDLDYNSLLDSESLFNKFQYLPYLNTNEYGEVAKGVDKDYYFEKFIPIYKYRGYKMNVYNQIKSLSDPAFCSNNVNGYVENDINWIQKDQLSFNKIIKRDKAKDIFSLKNYKEGLAVLGEIIRDCKTYNIKVIFVESPSYYKSSGYMAFNKKGINKIIRKISMDYEIKYYNFSKDSLCFNKGNFYNSMHMNKVGAGVFSKKIARILNVEK